MAKIKTNGAELYHERSGSGEPLLLVPGLMFSGESWRDQVDALSGEYECITMDLRGQHRSPATDDPDGYDLWNQAEDVHGLIGQLGIAPVHYAGLSMGGMIGMRIALTHPEDLRDLILIDTSARPEKPENVALYQAMRQVMEQGDAEAVLPALPPVFFADAYIADHADKVEAWLQTLRDGDHMGFVKASRAVDDREDVTARLAEIDLPTLVLHGGEDAAIPVENARSLAAGIPGATFQLVDGAGHQSNMDHPMEVTAAIRAFLASVRAVAPAVG